MTRALLCLILLVMAVALGTALFGGGRLRLSETTTATRSATTPVRTPTPPRPAPTATPQPVAGRLATATPTVAPSLSAAEAEQLVRAFFTAIENRDEGAITELTWGDALRVSLAILDEVKRQEEANHVRISAQVVQLEIAPTGLDGADRKLQVAYELALTAHAGFISLPVAGQAGIADFATGQRDGQPRIVRIEGDLDR